MSADNGVYILVTPTDDGYEYRVTETSAIENLNWDESIGDETNDEDVIIKNARGTWHGAKIYYKRGETLEAAHDLYKSLPICEYGVSEIHINRKF